MRKTRSDIITEMVNAAKACYQYYSDNELSPEVERRLVEVLEADLPQAIPTTEWEGYAKQYAERVASEV